MNDTQQKFLDQKGVEYLWSKISMQDYPNNEILISVINAIDETKADKIEIPFVDDTLVLENAAANAKAVGDALALKADKSELKNTLYITITDNNGTLISDTTYAEIEMAVGENRAVIADYDSTLFSIGQCADERKPRFRFQGELRHGFGRHNAHLCVSLQRGRTPFQRPQLVGNKAGGPCVFWCASDRANWCSLLVLCPGGNHHAPETACPPQKCAFHRNADD